MFVATDNLPVTSTKSDRSSADTPNCPATSPNFASSPAARGICCARSNKSALICSKTLGSLTSDIVFLTRANWSSNLIAA